MSSTDDLISTKELASKLKVTEPLLKKLVKDFGIETQRIDRRQHLDNQAATTVREILALRASGKKNSEIKEMFDASKQTKKAEEELEDKPKKKIKKANEKTTTKKKKKTKVVKEKSEKTDEKELKIETSIEETNDEAEKADDEADENLIDISSYLHEEDEEDSELKALLSIEEGDEEITNLDEDEDDIEEVDEIEEITDDTISPRKIRRRQFSFKYIQRQIANDSKRVNYIKQKLKKGRISTKERLMLEDSLHHRSVLLSGWIQLLRWVKN